MRKKNSKIQMLAGNRLKIRVGDSSQISTTLFEKKIFNFLILHPGRLIASHILKHM